MRASAQSASRPSYVVQCAETWLDGSVSTGDFMPKFVKTAAGLKHDPYQHRPPRYAIALLHEPLCRSGPLICNLRTTGESAARRLRMQMKLAVDFTEGWTSTGNKRRYAAVLVAAWVVFWLVLVGQPCCEAFALTPGHTQSQSTSDAPHLTGHADPDRHGAYCALPAQSASADLIQQQPLGLALLYI